MCAVCHAWVVWGNWHQQTLILVWWNLRRRQRRCRLSSAAQPAVLSAPAETTTSCLWSLDRSALLPKASTLEHAHTHTQAQRYKWKDRVNAVKWVWITGHFYEMLLPVGLNWIDAGQRNGSICHELWRTPRTPTLPPPSQLFQIIALVLLFNV